MPLLLEYKDGEYVLMMCGMMRFLLNHLQHGLHLPPGCDVA
jgi:hypothetical protein